jgi:streptomycin 6-kinase
MTSAFIVPEQLIKTCSEKPERAAWLQQLPETVHELQRRWSLDLAAPFAECSCAWVAPAVLHNGRPAVLKLGMPHMEGEHEIEGLRFWDGHPTVELIDCDVECNALLLEACVPGTPLRLLPEPEQDIVIVSLLHRLWRRPVAPHPFRSLSAMTAHWADESLAESSRWLDPGLTREALRVFAELSVSAPTDVLLATDLHAGNVLAAERASWLVIDPKPFIGDRAYDATQHLLNCPARLTADPIGTIRRFADLLGVDHARVRGWTFARLAAESSHTQGAKTLAIARVLAAQR